MVKLLVYIMRFGFTFSFCNLQYYATVACRFLKPSGGGFGVYGDTDGINGNEPAGSRLVTEISYGLNSSSTVSLISVLAIRNECI